VCVCVCSKRTSSIAIKGAARLCAIVIRDSSKLAFFIHIKFANNANWHIRRICTHRLIFVSIGVNSLAIFLTKRTRITTNRA